VHVLRVEVVVELNSGFESISHAVLQTVFTLFSQYIQPEK